MNSSAPILRILACSSHPSTGGLAMMLTLLIGLGAPGNLFGAETVLSREQKILYETIVRYRDKVSKGMKAHYRITCNALDADKSSATWLHDCVVQGRYSRVSWLLESSTGKIAENGTEADTTEAFTACAISLSPQGVEWLDRTDGMMVIYPFSKNEQVKLNEQALPKAFYPYLEHARLEDRYQLSSLTLPFNIFNGFNLGGFMARGGWLLMHDDDFLRTEAAKVTVEKSSDTTLILKRMMDDAEFAESYQVTEDFKNSHTQAEIEAALKEIRQGVGSFYHRLYLKKEDGGWVAEKAETGTREETEAVSMFTYDESGVLKSCVTTVAESPGIYQQYDLLKVEGRVSPADLAIDPSEARTIRDAATGMTIEPH